MEYVLRRAETGVSEPETAKPRPRSVQEIADSLAEEIRSGRIPAGAWIRQETVANQFGVSRQPVREALRLVEASGLVKIVLNRGAVVLAPSLRDVRELFALRAQLEGFAAELAAIQRESSHLEAFEQAIALFNEASDAEWAPGSGIPEQWVRANDLFHGTLLEASGNQRLTTALVDIETGVPGSIVGSALAASPRELRLSMIEHQGILDAIRDRDSTLARLRTIQHVRTAGDIVMRRIQIDEQ